MKSDTTTNAISSPESAAGLSPCDGPDLKTPEESGPAPVPVSRFRALAKDRATPMSGTCGPLFTASSPSAVLQRSLESKLRARMDANGSPEFALTWKTWDMPAGQPICALRASARRTGGKGCIGWRSPQASDGEGGVMEIRPDCAGKYKLRDEAALVGWPTPQANKNTKNSKDPQRMKENGAQTCLADAAHLAGWSTPTVQDSANNAGPSQFNRNTHPLNVQATLAARPTPNAEDAESAGMRHSRGVADTLSAQAGQDASRSNAETGRPAGFRLNPRFSLWLMGYPAEWASCGERAMQSCQKSRRRS